MIHIYKIFSTWYWSIPKALLLSAAVVGFLGSTEQGCRTGCSSLYKATCRQIGVWQVFKGLFHFKEAGMMLLCLAELWVSTSVVLQSGT